MILVVDVQYEEENAVVAGVLFSDWRSDEVESDRTKNLTNIAPYEPGSFYKRELPCILSLLENISEQIDTIVIDGYVTLGIDNEPGLGMHLYQSIAKRSPIIGVAKNRFKDTPQICELRRGSSQKPLLITAIGMPLDEAKQKISYMHGENRTPTLLKRVDQLCRGIIDPL